jgi:hypothetical protein
MPQTAFAGDIAYDWEMWIGRTVASVTTWTQIFGWESIPFPEPSAEDIDVTHMQSPERTRENVPGIGAVIEWSQEKQLWAADPGDILLNALYGLTEAGTKEDVLIEFNIDPAGTSIRRTYRGHVKAFTPTGTVGDKEMVSVALALRKSQATNPRTISGG